MAKNEFTNQDARESLPPSLDTAPFQFADWAFNYPVAPGYINGCDSGKAAQIAFIKYLQHEGYQDGGGALQHMALCLVDQFHEAKSEGEKAAIRGKIVGVFSELELWLRYAAKNASTDDVRNATPKSIHQALQDASGNGPQKRWEDSVRQEASDRARKAALARWAKRKGSESVSAA
jgi:hypothetical protein